MRALVVGGTGPTGHFIVNGLRARGWTVAILHTGNHEVAEIPADVEHIHTDPFDIDALTAALGTRTFDLAIVTYGRLRRVAEALVGRVGRLVSVGGFPAYSGYMNATAWQPHGMPVPTAEDARTVADEAEDAKGWRIVRTEERVFECHPDATHFRYPYVYGPYQIAPREWCIVRRILDGRRRIVVPDDGLSLNHFGYAGNLAHAVLLAVDQPEAARGQVFNAGDIEQLTLRQAIEVIAAALDHPLEIVSMPYALAKCARPMLAQPWTTHRLVDLTRLRTRLGYTDVHPPREALAATARWLVANPLPPGGSAERVLQDPFDYATEDALIAAWQAALASMPPIRWPREPGYTASFSGPGGKERSSSWKG